MNELEQTQTEQMLQRGIPPSAPPHLRATVLAAIEAQRDVDSQTQVLTANSGDFHWLARADQMATFAAPCLLMISLLVFTLVDRSTDNLYRGQSGSFSRARAAANDSSFAKQEPLNTPRAFFRQHYAILQNLHAELFRDTSKKAFQTDGDQPPLGHFRRDPNRRFRELASVTRSRVADGSPT